MSSTSSRDRHIVTLNLNTEVIYAFKVLKEFGMYRSRSDAIRQGLAWFLGHEFDFNEWLCFGLKADMEVIDQNMTEKQIQQMKNQIADTDEFVHPEDCEELIDISNNFNAEKQYYCHNKKGRGGQTSKKEEGERTENEDKPHHLQIITVNIETSQLRRLNQLLDRGVYPSRSELVRIAMWKYLEHMRSIIETAKHESGNGARVKVENGHEYIKVPVTVDKFGKRVEKWVPILGQTKSYKSHSTDSNPDSDPNTRGPKHGAKRVLSGNPHWEEVWNGAQWLKIPIPYESRAHAEYITLYGVNVPIMRIKDFQRNNNLPDTIRDTISEIVRKRRTDILVYKALHEHTQTHMHPSEDSDETVTAEDQKLEQSLHAS